LLRGKDGGREGGREGKEGVRVSKSISTITRPPFLRPSLRTCAIAVLLLKRDKLAVQVGDLLSWQVVQGVLVNDARAFVLLVPFFEVGKRDKETLALLGLG
jgi:hypothetical protein